MSELFLFLLIPGRLVPKYPLLTLMHTCIGSQAVGLEAVKEGEGDVMDGMS